MSPDAVHRDFVFGKFAISCCHSYNAGMAQKMLSRQQFKVLIERDEDGYFIASVPALPGCHTQAKSLSQLKKRLKEVIALCLDAAKTSPAYRKQIQLLSYEPTFVGLETVEV